MANFYYVTELLHLGVLCPVQWCTLHVQTAVGKTRQLSAILGVHHIPSGKTVAHWGKGQHGFPLPSPISPMHFFSLIGFCSHVFTTQGGLRRCCSGNHFHFGPLWDLFNTNELTLLHMGCRGCAERLCLAVRVGLGLPLLVISGQV